MLDMVKHKRATQFSGGGSLPFWTLKWNWKALKYVTEGRAQKEGQIAYTVTPQLT